jgi:predicted metal-binding membrane protein
MVPAVGMLIGGAWLALAAWPGSPHGRFAHHHGGIAMTAGAPAQLLLVAAWTVMIVAMMLPTSLPLLVLFHRLTRHRRDHVLLAALVVSGYLAVWAAFGAGAIALDGFLHGLIDRIASLQAHAWALGAGVLAVAGLYQFSRLKYACLDVCRSPQSFLTAHWLGRREPGQAFRLGVRHGAFCVGCCWSLMLLMFVIGAGSFGWMLALGGVMAIEKNVSWGRRLSAPVGIALLCWSIVTGARALLAA